MQLFTIPVRSLAVLTATVTLGLYAPAQSSAQTEAPALLYMGMTQVKPDMVEEWEDLYKNEVIPGLKKAQRPVELEMWETAILGQAHTYVAVIPFPNLAAFDLGHPLIEVLGEEGFQRLSGKIRKCTVSTRVSVARPRMDLSIFKEDFTPGIAVVVDIDIVPGRSADFERLLASDVVPAMRKLGVDGYWVNQTVMGGNPNRWTIVAAHNKFADLDKGPLLVRALGAEGAAKLAAKSAGIIQSIEYMIARPRPDLSFNRR